MPLYTSSYSSTTKPISLDLNGDVMLYFWSYLFYRLVYVDAVWSSFQVLASSVARRIYYRNGTNNFFHFGCKCCLSNSVCFLENILCSMNLDWDCITQITFIGTVLRYILSFLIEIGEIIEPSSLVMSYIEFHSTSLVKLQTFNY